MFLVALLLGSVDFVNRLDVQERRLTLDVRAAPIKSVVARLSKASNVPLDTASVVNGEVVLLHLIDCPLSEVESRLATAIHGTWKKSGDTAILTRTPAQQREIELVERRHRTDQIRAEFAKATELQKPKLDPVQAKKVVDQLVKLRDKSKDYAFSPFSELAGPQNMVPARRALIRLVSQMDPNGFNMLSPGDRVVYSNKPTAMQQALPFSVDQLLSDFNDENSIWFDSIATVQVVQTSRMTGDPLDQSQLSQGIADRVVLAAIRTNSSSSVQFQIFFVSGATVVAQSGLWLGNDFIRNSSKFMSGASQAGEAMHLSRQSLDMLEATRGFQRNVSQKDIQPNLAGLELLTHPDKVDPLSLVATDGFLSAAVTKKLNLVAVLPDELVVLNFIPLGKDPTVQDFLNKAIGFGELKVAVQEGWMVVTPERPYTSGVNRIDRTALGTYLRSLVTNGRATLDAQADYALHSPPTNFDTYAMAMGMLLDPDSTQNVDRDWITLKLWGSLTKPQRQILTAGQKLYFNTLTPVQLDFVRREAYGRMMKSRVARLQGSQNDWLLNNDPTQCLPNGLPANGYLSAKSTATNVILASSSQRDVRISYARIHDPASMGSTLAYQESSTSSFKPMFDRFQLIERRTYDITYQYSPNVADQAAIHDVVVPKGSHPVSLADLPEEVRRRIAASKEETRARIAATPPDKAPPP